jgi:hypothetical protein
MKNPGKAIRDAYMAALSGVTYSGSALTVYDNMPIETTPDRYAYINAVTYDQVGNNQLFIYNGSVAVDVVVKQYKKIDYDTLDDIAEKVQNAILALPTSTVTDANYTFIAPTIESATYINDQDGAYHMCRKIIRFSQSLIQK